MSDFSFFDIIKKLYRSNEKKLVIDQDNQNPENRNYSVSMADVLNAILDSKILKHFKFCHENGEFSNKAISPFVKRKNVTIGSNSEYRLNQESLLNSLNQLLYAVASNQSMLNDILNNLEEICQYKMFNWYLDLQHNMDVFELVNEVEWSRNEKKAFLNLLEHLKRKEETKYEALLYLLIASFYPDPAIYDKPLPKRMIEAMSTENFFALLKERHKEVFLPPFDFYNLTFAIKQFFDISLEKALKITYIDYSVLFNTGEEFKHTNNYHRLSAYSESDLQQIADNPLNCGICEIQDYYLQKYYNFSDGGGFQWKDCDYVCYMISKISDTEKEEIIFDKLKKLLIFILNQLSENNCCFYNEIPELIDKIEKIDSINYCGDNLKALSIKLADCFLRITAAVVQASDNRKKSFQLYSEKSSCPLSIDTKYDYLREQLDNSSSFISDDISPILVKDYLNFFNVEADNVRDNPEHFKDFCQSFGLAFSTAVNNRFIQENFILNNQDFYQPLIGLYNRLYHYNNYSVIKGKTHNIIANPQNDLALTLVAYNYNKIYQICKTDAYDFKWYAHNGVPTDFRIRLATKNDITNLHKMNNPSLPFSRNVFIRSKDEELEYGVNNGFIWLIEDISFDNPILVCEAIIIPNVNEDDKQLCDYYQTSKLILKWAEDNKRDVHSFFSIFDAIIVNPGNNGNTYRGIGFQRLMLQLCYFLSKEKAKFFAATVSPVNLHSHRNFDINGYQVVDRTHYTFKDESEYYKIYSDECNMAEIPNHVDDYLIKHNLSESDYRTERVAVRDLVIFEL